MKRLRIYIALPYFADSRALKLLTDIGDVVIRNNYPRPSEEELMSLSKEFDILIIGVQEKMTKRVLLQASRLKAIGTLSAGLDHIDEGFRKSGKFDTFDAAGANAQSVAEFALALMLVLCKKVFDARHVVETGGDRSEIGETHNLQGKVIGLLGAGRTASAVARLLKGFQTNLLCWTQNPNKHTELQQLGLEFCSLSDLLTSSDIVSLHLPLTPGTIRILNSSRLAMLRAGSLVVNTARAALIDNAELFSLVGTGRIGGVGIDDFPAEIGHPVPQNSRIIVTPHIAGTSVEALADMQLAVASKIAEKFGKS